jgi:co-chaperonin GroES (HSP10)
MKKRKIIPMAGRVHISRVDPEAKTDSGIYIPAEAQKRTDQGTVISVGADVDPQIVPGVKILHNLCGGINIGNDEAIVQAKEINCIIKD